MKRLSPATLIGTGVAAGLFTLQATVVDAVADPTGVAALDTRFSTGWSLTARLRRPQWRWP